jgi:Family of unknown function (DUF6544)
MRTKFLREVAALGLPTGPGPDTPVADADLAALPEPAQRYLRFMGVVGRPRDWSFRARVAGRFRRSATAGWLDCECWQYNTRLDLARIFHLTLKMGGVVPVLGRDTYVRGKGRMLIRPLDLFTVVDGQGPEFDLGELVIYLNDAIMLAPTMVLGAETRWSPVDPGAFDVALTHRGTTVTARVFVDARGAVTDFSTTDRFYAPGNATPVRAKWTTPVEGWQSAGGRMFPTRGQAVWQFPEGPLPYADLAFRPEDIAFNVPPGV